MSAMENGLSDAIAVIAGALKAEAWEITDIKMLKKGMTNRSFLFSCRNRKYIMRIPGEGTGELINREDEAEVYRKISGRGISDNVIYLNPLNGYKITEYFESARVCDASDTEDIRKCMKKLRKFHELELQVGHEFSIFKQIALYETLWKETSRYKDYMRTKERVFSLQSYIRNCVEKKVLTHIDAVPDNFLFIKDENGDTDIRLIDWEYAGMQDPHVDIAMFCIYSLYGKEKIDYVIDLYFTEGCPDETRIKIYCYIASCGLLWSNWCEYKRQLGVEFGEYSLRQYLYAKDYYEVVQKELKRREER